ncbi:MAG: single-stranded-DNA-specific exonuclease RecJ [Eubacterium sp.]
MSYKKWVVRDADKEKASALSEKFNIDPFIAFLLVSRGIDDDMAVSGFLADSYMLCSPYDFADMEEASFVIGDAIDNGDKICIYGDYDCDGVTSTALLYDFLKNEGADVCYYIPSREHEGYGLNNSAIDKIAEMGVNLIVTVDNGISAVNEAEHIYELGMSLVITDHHQLADTMPRAEAVVNPHRPDNNLKFCDYCGVGVAFKLISAMYEGDIEELINEYADLVAIGTIADVMPLINENRAFVRAGLEKINNNPRTSIKAFIESNGEKKYSANDIAFQLCPRLNAMGRMGDARRAVEFLISDNQEDCSFKCEQLNLENSYRQETEKKILDDIDNKINENPNLVGGRVIVIAGEDYHHGVIGIVASHVLEKYGKPAIIIGVDDDGIAKGSARSVDGFNIFEAISFCADDLIQFGGHPLAAGITLSADRVDDFRRKINEYALEKYPLMPPQQLVIDCKLSPFYLSLDLVDSLSSLEPYGAGNPQAVFGIYNMRLLSVSPMSDGKHIRMELEKKGKKIKVVKFGEDYSGFPYSVGDILNIAVRVSKNFYNEKTYLSVQAVDVKLASADDDKYFSQKNDYELFRLNNRICDGLYPDRTACAAVYSYLKRNNGYNYGIDNLYFRLQDKVTYSQLIYSLKAFAQAGLITFDTKIMLNPVKGKVDLEKTKILSSLKERLSK